MIGTLQWILLGWSYRDRWDGRGMWHVWGKKCLYGIFVGRPELCGLRWGLVMDGKMILKWILIKQWESVHCIRVTQDRDEIPGCCEYGHETSSCITRGEFPSEEGLYSMWLVSPSVISAQTSLFLAVDRPSFRKTTKPDPCLPSRSAQTNYPLSRNDVTFVSCGRCRERFC